MKLTYLSHSCFLVETGDHRLLIDPFLTGNPKATAAAAEVECDFILITHGHNDHVGDAIEIAKRTGATIIANFEIATWCGEQGCSNHPMHVGGAHRFPFGRVKLTIAHHGSTFQGADSSVTLGPPTGFLITAEGMTLYHAGDTGLFLDMQLIGRLERIDLALLPIGDNFTMGIDDAVHALELLKPKVAIPMHYGTFDLIDVDPLEFARKGGATGTDIRVLNIGQTLEF